MERNDLKFDSKHIIAGPVVVHGLEDVFPRGGRRVRQEPTGPELSSRDKDLSRKTVAQRRRRAVSRGKNRTWFRVSARLSSPKSGFGFQVKDFAHSRNLKLET